MDQSIVIDLTEPTLIDLTIPDINERKWISIKNKSNKWRGIDRGDGRYRLYKHISIPAKIRRRNKNGKLIHTFSRDKLIKIAWKIGVSNPDGFDYSDVDYLGCGQTAGYIHFSDGWTKTNKDAIGNYIWNRLYDTNRIIHNIQL